MSSTNFASTIHRNTTLNRRTRAVVIGGSLAGLMTARVLSHHFQQVFILERDSVSSEPQSRKGQAHTRHTHVLLAKGFQILNDYFPGIEQALVEGGAEVVDFTEQVRWLCNGGMAKQQFGNLPYVLASRPFLECLIRNRVLALENVELVDNCKTHRLLVDASCEKVTGVEVEHRNSQAETEKIEADLVVDASGRGSQASKWLGELGFEPPREEKIEIGVGYATRVYRRRDGDIRDGKLICVLPSGADESRGGCLVPMEDDRWICTLAGWGGDHASNDERQFMDYAKSLPSTEIADAIEQLEPIGDILTYKYPASLRRHYSQMKRHPIGFLVLGDAVCSFNPIFGQGMTSTCCQAQMLDHALARHDKETRVWKRYYRMAAKYIDRAWATAAAGDFQFPTTKGEKPMGVDLMNSYINLIHRTSHHDSVVFRAFVRVTNLINSPSSLMHPLIVARVGMFVVKKVAWPRLRQTIAPPLRVCASLLDVTRRRSRKSQAVPR